jgi:hypothetical protein
LLLQFICFAVEFIIQMDFTPCVARMISSTRVCIFAAVLLLLLQLSIDVPFFSMDLGLSSCVKVQGSAFPRYKAYWSCGMKVTGSSMCTPGDGVLNREHAFSASSG